MKACKFCGTQVDNNERHCPGCGSAVFLHICENCGTRFDSGFCPNCGVKAGQAKKICPECKTAYFSNACPNCGYLPGRMPAVQKVEQTVVHRHVYEEAPPSPAPSQARRGGRGGRRGKGCGCLIWFLVILLIAGMFGANRSGKRSTGSSVRTVATVRPAARVTKDPNATEAPTATPEPAVAAAQEKVDAYFARAGEKEIAAVREADSALEQYRARESGKVLLVRRSWAEDRGYTGKSKDEPNYIGALGYAAVYTDQKPEKDPNCGTTPWRVPVYRKDRQFWERAGTVDHKTEVAVIGQELTMPRYTYSTSRCSGYLHVIRTDTGEDCWLDVANYVGSPYWEKDLTGAQEKGYCLAAFRQVSDYYPVTRGNEKAALEDGTVVLLPLRTTVSGSGPDKNNNAVPGIVFRQQGAYMTGVTVWFNTKDLTLTY